jgi:hypothetical protein
MKILKPILKLIALIAVGYFVFFYLDTNGELIPTKISEIYEHKELKDYQIIDFKEFQITTLKGWKDKGFRTQRSLGWRGKLKKDGVVFYYSYGHLCYPSTETLEEYLFLARTDDFTMAEAVVVDSTETTISVEYRWAVDWKTSDTIITGIMTDSLRKKYRSPYSDYKNCNYYSWTSYMDSVYFVGIVVPEIIVNSHIENISKNGYSFNVLKPKQAGKGLTKVFVSRGDWWNFSLHAEDLDYSAQEELIKIALSIKFKENI